MTHPATHHYIDVPERDLSAMPAWKANIENKLKPFQKQVREFMMTRPASAAWLGMGSGKTIITLSALSMLGEAGHILVVAPRNIAISTWPEEVTDWNIPLTVTSLNITMPGAKTLTGRPVRNQRNLAPNEYRRIVDDIALAPAQMYTVSKEGLEDLIAYLAHQGTPRVRPVGEPHPDGHIDLDALRDARLQLLDSFKGTQEAPRYTWTAKQLAALRGSQFTALKAATAKHPVTLIVGHPDPNIARVLRQTDLTDDLALRLREITGAELRVGVQIAHPDYSTWPFPTIVLDESQGFKNKQSNRWRALVKARPFARRVIELSGTPMPEGETELWAQIYLLDQGQLFGEDYQAHLKAWFRPDQMINGQVVSWTISKHNRDQLHQAVSPLAISAENVDLDLPGYTDLEIHTVTMTEDQREAYENFKIETVMNALVTGLAEIKEKTFADVLAKTGDHEQATAAADEVTLDDATVHQIEAVNAGVLHGRLMQFAAGAIYLDIEPGHPDWDKATEFTKKPILRIHDLKYDAVEAILTEHFADPDARSVLIAHRFQFQEALLLQRLHAMGITGARSYNGMPDTKLAWNRGEIPVMLIHPASAGHGLNLQYGGSRLIWLSPPDSGEHYEQTPARLNRVGQTDKVKLDIILTADTKDVRMPTVLGQKSQRQSALLTATRADLKDALAQAREQINNS